MRWGKSRIMRDLQVELASRNNDIWALFGKLEDTKLKLVTSEAEVERLERLLVARDLVPHEVQEEVS